MQPETVIGSFLITLFLVASIVIILRRTAALEMRLILLGIFAAVAAVLYGTLPGTGGGVQMSLPPGGGPPSGSFGFQAGGLASLPYSLMKIGFVLILAGVGVALLTRWNAADVTFGEGPSDVK